MTINDSDVHEGHASGCSIPMHFHKDNSPNCLAEELSHNIYSFKGGMLPVRTRVESLKTIEDDLGSQLASKGELHSGAVEFVFEESSRQVQELKLLSMGISQSHMNGAKSHEVLLESHLRLSKLHRSRVFLSKFIETVQCLEFSATLLSSLSRRNLHLHANAIMDALDEIPDSVLAKQSIQVNLAQRLSRARESLILDIIECAIMNKPLTDQYGESGPDRLIANWEDFDLASPNLRFSCLSCIATHLGKIVPDENLSNHLVGWFTRLSGISTSFPTLSDGWVQHASNLIIEALGIYIYKFSNSSSVPAFSSPESEISLQSLFEIHQEIVENPISRRFANQLKHLPDFVGDPLKMMRALNHVISKIPKDPQTDTLTWIHDLEWLVCCSCVRSTVLLKITEHIREMVSGETTSSRACVIVDAMREFVKSRQCESMDLSLMNTALQSVVASTVVSSLCEYMETHASEEIDSMIPKWGEIFADLYSRITRVCERRSQRGHRSMSFKTVFDFLGLLTHTDSHVVRTWCLAQLDEVPARYLHYLIHHVSGERYANDVEEINALILNSIKVD